jgi:long-subunit acyl-CoA synthetase (AMP-forming)
MTTPRRPVSDIFVEAAMRWPGRAFIASRSHPGESGTFGQFLDQAPRVATALRKRGIEPGDAVALFAENRPRWCVAHAGILLAGGLAVALDALATDETVAFILEDSGAKLAISTSALRGHIPGSLRLDEDWDELQAEAGDLPELEGGDRAMALVYTSGTTGMPKGCIVTHVSMQLELHGIPLAGELTSDDCILQFLPLQRSIRDS